MFTYCKGKTHIIPTPFPLTHLLFLPYLAIDCSKNEVCSQKESF